METTPVSLLERVRDRSDHEAWTRFVRLYTPLIYYWTRRCGLQEEDAADLTQEVFTTLFQKLPEFTYDRHKSFRGWLRTLTLNHWRDLPKRRANRQLHGDDARLKELTVPEQVSVLEEMEYRWRLVEQALELMQPDFQAETWKAFWEHGIKRRRADEVASELGLTLASVYSAKFRVLTRLRAELQGLLD